MYCISFIGGRQKQEKKMNVGYQTHLITIELIAWRKIISQKYLLLCSSEEKVIRVEVTVCS